MYSIGIRINAFGVVERQTTMVPQHIEASTVVADRMHNTHTTHTLHSTVHTRSPIQTVRCVLVFFPSLLLFHSNFLFSVGAFCYYT